MVLTLVKQLEIAWTALSGSDDPDDEIRIAALDELIALLFSEVWDGKKGVAFAETYFDIPDKEISHKLGNFSFHRQKQPSVGIQKAL